MKSAVILAITAASLYSTSALANECVTDECTDNKNEYITIQLSDVDFGYGLKGRAFGFGYGQKLSNNFGVTGEVNVITSSDTSLINGNELEQDFKGFSFNIGPEYYITNELSVYGTIGLINYSNRSKSNNQDWVLIANPSPHYDYSEKNNSSNSDVTVIYGIGARYKVTETYSLFANYKTFGGEWTVLSETVNYDAGIYSVGLGIHF